MSHFNNSFSKLIYRPFVLVISSVVFFTCVIFGSILIGLTMVEFVNLSASGKLITEILPLVMPLIFLGLIGAFAMYVMYHQAGARRLVVDDARMIAKLLGKSPHRDVSIPSGRTVCLKRLDGTLMLSVEDPGYVSGDFIFRKSSVTASYESAFLRDQINRVDGIFVELRQVLQEERS